MCQGYITIAQDYGYGLLQMTERSDTTNRQSAIDNQQSEAGAAGLGPIGMIQEQVVLPINVAFGVVTQGMRIRFGRSLVTIMGVVLGVAFLMAILTGQVVTLGVTGEEQIRVEIKRMYSFLAAEIGPARGRSLGFVQAGVLSDEEQRFLAQLEEEGLQKILWADLSNAAVPEDVSFESLQLENVELAGLGENTSAIVVSGDGTLTAGQWQAVRDITGGPVVCVTRASMPDEADADYRPVNLGRAPTEDELAKMAEETRKSRFRNTWIVIISLVVTVIGISNAMLISVTERFREIGTMKCLGALSRFVRLLFLIEASIMGLAGAVVGAMLGTVFSLLMYSFTYSWDLVFGSLDLGALINYLGLSLVAGIILSIVAAIYPAHIASKMIPADALRSNI